MQDCKSSLWDEHVLILDFMSTIFKEVRRGLSAAHA